VLLVPNGLARKRDAILMDQGLTVEVLLAATDDVELASAEASFSLMTLVDVTVGLARSVLPEGSTVSTVVLFTIGVLAEGLTVIVTGGTEALEVLWLCNRPAI